MHTPCILYTHKKYTYIHTPKPTTTTKTTDKTDMERKDKRWREERKKKRMKKTYIHYNVREEERMTFNFVRERGSSTYKSWYCGCSKGQMKKQVPIQM